MTLLVLRLYFPFLMGNVKFCVLGSNAYIVCVFSFYLRNLNMQNHYLNSIGSISLEKLSVQEARIPFIIFHSKHVVVFVIGTFYFPQVCELIYWIFHCVSVRVRSFMWKFKHIYKLYCLELSFNNFYPSRVFKLCFPTMLFP